MESHRRRRRPYEQDLQLDYSSHAFEAETPKSRPISRVALSIAALGVVIATAGSVYLYIAARDAMGGPASNLPTDQVYVLRCGACHAAPPAEEFSKWGARDWSRMLPLTMFMAGEQDEVHHYLERVGGKSGVTPSGTNRPSLP